MLLSHTPATHHRQDPFLRGLGAYLKARAFNTTTHAELWRALGASTGEPIEVRCARSARHAL